MKTKLPIQATHSIVSTFNADLLIKLRRGEARAYEKLYQACKPMIVHFIHDNRGTQEDAKDILQEAMVILFQQLQRPDFNLTCCITTYLYSICQKKWLYHLRKRKNSLVSIDEWLVRMCAYIVEDEYIGMELHLQINQAMSRLDEKSRQLLIGYYYEVQSLEQLAQGLQYSNANVAKVRKCKCIKRLREEAKALACFLV